MNFPQFFNAFFTLPRWQKRTVMILLDLTLIPLALWSSFALRLSTWTPNLNDGIYLLIIAPLISIPIFTKLGLYRAILRFLGHQAINAVFKGTLISALALVLTTTLFNLEGIPRSIYIIYFGTAFLLLGGTRHLIRRYYHLTQNNNGQRINVAIYGAGTSGAQLAQALFNSPEYRPVLFLDDRDTLQKAFVHSLKVHAPDELDNLIAKHQIKQILLAIPSASIERRQKILQSLEPLPVHVRSIPGMAELVAGKSIDAIREISIDELLGRPPVAPEQGLLQHCISTKNVMVTGAGGSIGAELCRQIINLKPNKLILFEISEFALYQIEQELLTLAQDLTTSIAIIPVIGSVQNQALIERALDQHAVQTLYHAAAYKHVPLVEQNPVEGIRNNVFGTWYTANAAYSVGIEHFILISTDKAVRPTNVMGASKRMAELGLQALAQHTAATTFSMVRFGNVLGSSGSVVPLFRKQIKAGGPITVTHPDIIRYFMTIPEAAQLVIQAGSMARGGEVFVLDMGAPVKIIDLARRMIRLSGLIEKTETHPTGDINIQFSGLRPGEKLYEELLISSDSAASTQHPRIFQAHEASISHPQYQTALDRLDHACRHNNMAAIHQLLNNYVSGYQHAALRERKVIPLPLESTKIRFASGSS